MVQMMAPIGYSYGDELSASSYVGSLGLHRGGEVIYHKYSEILFFRYLGDD